MISFCLGAIDRSRGVAKFTAAPCFHFGENKDRAITIDEVDFAPSLGSEIPVQHFFTGSPEKLSSETFPGAADEGVPFACGDRSAVGKHGDAIEFPVAMAKVDLVKQSHGKLNSIWETGAKLRRWIGQGPCLRRAARCCAVPYPLWRSNPYSG